MTTQDLEKIVALIDAGIPAVAALIRRNAELEALLVEAEYQMGEEVLRRGAEDREYESPMGDTLERVRAALANPGPKPVGGYAALMARNTRLETFLAYVAGFPTAQDALNDMIAAGEEITSVDELDRSLEDLMENDEYFDKVIDGARSLAAKEGDAA